MLNIWLCTLQFFEDMYVVLFLLVIDGVDICFVSFTFLGYMMCSIYVQYIVDYIFT